LGVAASAFGTASPNAKPS